MARYSAKGKLYNGVRIVEEGEEFDSEAVPGLLWKPLDKAARDAVKARAFVSAPGRPPANPAADAEVAALKAQLAEAQAQIEALTAPPVAPPIE